MLLPATPAGARHPRSPARQAAKAVATVAQDAKYLFCNCQQQQQQWERRKQQF
jgi:hypothetical protein